MNAVEIEEAISALAEQPFDAQEFPFAFLQAFGNKETTIKRLRAGVQNKSDLGGVLQTKNIHIAVCSAGEVTKTLGALRASPATAKAKAHFILATDGADFEAEDLETGDMVACAYQDFPDHFGFFLPLAGITTVKEVRESSFDIRATSRLNRLYVELHKDNPDWGTAERRHDMNHFMARLIFCFFAERTDIFQGIGLFTNTIEQMSAKNSSNTHEVIGELFRAMNTKREDRAGIPRWANVFPYVNGAGDHRPRASCEAVDFSSLRACGGARRAAHAPEAVALWDALEQAAAEIRNGEIRGCKRLQFGFARARDVSGADYAAQAFRFRIGSGFRGRSSDRSG